jgi:hypothetical protein
VVEPLDSHSLSAAGRSTTTRGIYTLDGRTPPGELHLQAGDLVRLRHFPAAERRLDGVSQSLRGVPIPGHPPLRLRWLSLARPEGAIGRVVATRHDLLYSFVAGLDLCDLPDPLQRLPAVLNETLQNNQSTIMAI